MTLSVIYDGADSTPVVIPFVQSVGLVAHDTIVTNTFGNGPVTHRHVAAFTIEYTREEAAAIAETVDSTWPDPRD